MGKKGSKLVYDLSTCIVRQLGVTDQTAIFAGPKLLSANCANPLVDDVFQDLKP